MKDIKKKIPKKFHIGLDFESFDEDGDGYWIMAKDGYTFGTTQSETGNGETWKDFLDCIKSLRKSNI